MKVSVLLAAYNGEKTIKETIESVLNQKYKNLELIIVNDGSNDGTDDIIKNFDDNRIIYLKQKNSGAQASPRNKALSVATGEFCALIDQDDLWYPGKIYQQINAYRECQYKEMVGIIVTRADFIYSDGRVYKKSESVPEGFLSQLDSFSRLLKGDFITACSAVVPTKVLKEYEGFNEIYKGNDEYDLWFRIAQKYGILGVNHPLCAWRNTGENFSKDLTDIFIGNEKILKSLITTQNDSEILNALIKNNNRIIVSAIINKRYSVATKYFNKYELNPKMKLLKRIYFISPLSSRLLLNILSPEL